MKKQENKNQELERFADEPFIPLRDLVYAPIEALMHADAALRAQILELVEGTGTRITHRTTGESVLKLETFNLLYQQLRNEKDAGQTLEEVLLRVPLLSMLPPSGMKIKHSLIRFDAEVRHATSTIPDGHGKKQYTLEARVCPPKGRRADRTSKIHFEVELSSTKQPEGLARLLDILNTNAIPESCYQTPVGADGTPASQEQRAIFIQRKRIRAQAARLAQVKEGLAGGDEAIQAELDAAIANAQACEQALLREELAEISAFLQQMKEATHDEAGG